MKVVLPEPAMPMQRSTVGAMASSSLRASRRAVFGALHPILPGRLPMFNPQKRTKWTKRTKREVTTVGIWGRHACVGRKESTLFARTKRRTTEWTSSWAAR